MARKSLQVTISRPAMAFLSRTIVQLGIGLGQLCACAAAERSDGDVSTQLACLADGRVLEYAEFGNPAGPLVLYFHGTPGSHLELQAATAEIQRSGLYIVAVNRPGIGRSTYQPLRRITDWPADVCALLAALGRGQEPVGIVGFSGGAPYALVCGLAFPERISHLALVSGHTFLGAPGTNAGEEDHLIRMIIRRPRLGEIAAAVTTRRLKRHPNMVVRRVTKNWNSADRRLFECDPDLRCLLATSLRYTTLCGTSGIVTDVQLLGSCWGFPVSNVCRVPVSLWHGQCDRIAPVSMGHYFHQQIPGSVLHIDPRAGHVTMLKWHAAEILKQFRNP